MPQDNSRLPYGVVYGPVKSRRLGNSLGINVLPVDCKICSFDCIYCQYGWTDIHTIDEKKLSKIEFPKVERIIEEIGIALHNCLTSKIPIDYITFSGYGEPTLHPQFNEIVKLTKGLRDKYIKEINCPKIPIAVISNSTNIEEAKKGLQEADIRVMKLDAGDTQTFNRINQPASGIELKNIIEELKKLQNIVIQTMFLELNSTEPAVEAWIDCIMEIKPAEIHIYTLDRAPADSKIIGVKKTILENIAIKTIEKTGIKTKTF